MKKLFIKLAIGLLALSASLSASGPRVTSSLFVPIENEILALEVPPLYSSHTADGGMVFEIIQAALNSEKESVTLTTYPVKNMVKYYIIQDTSLAAVGINWKLSEAQKKNIISIPVALIPEYYIYYKTAHPEGISFKNGLSNLKDMTYGAHPEEDVSLYEKENIKIVYAESRFLFKKLKTGKVDFIKVPLLSAQTIVNNTFAADKSNFVLVNDQPQKSVCKILFNLNNTKAKELSDKFRQGLLTIINNGHYQKIIEKYHGKLEYNSKFIQELVSLLKQ